MIRFGLLDKYTSRFAVDLGTANTLIVCAETGEVLLDQPSVVAVKTAGMSGDNHICGRWIRSKDDGRKNTGRYSGHSPFAAWRYR